MDSKTKVTLNELLYGSQGQYGHLFPYRNRVPTIHKHIFTDFKQSKDPLDQTLVSKMLNIDYIGWTAKAILNIDLFPVQIAMLQMMWNTPFPMLIACRGGSKSWMLAVYAILRALLDPGSKIVIVGAGLRQARLVFNYIDTMWSNAPVLRNIVGGGKNAGPRQNVDLCYFKVGDSIVYALPTGDGTKIRGFRASVIIADEFACLDRNTLVETSNGLERISNISDLGTTVINKYGDFEPIASFIKTPKTDVYEVSTKYGYGFKCSNIHKVLTTDGWKLGKDLTNEDFLVIKNQYIFPEHPVNVFMTEDIAWLMGLLISDGDVTRKYGISIRTVDKDLVKQITTKFEGLSPKVYTREAYVDKRGWKCQKSYEVHIHNTLFREKLYSLGIDYVGVANKTIPSTILKSPKNIVASFLSGLFEGDGSCFLWKDRGTTKLGVAYYTISDILAQDVQTLLLKFDIIISRQTRVSKLSDKKQWILRSNGHHAASIVKLFNIPKWNDLLTKAQTYFYPDDYCITFDKSRDKWRASVYYGGKLHYLGRYFDKNDALDAVKNFQVTHDPCIRVKLVTKLPHQDHLYDFHLPLTHSFYGNGFVQHNSVPEDVFDIVVRGFAATAKTPMEEAKKIAFDKTLAGMDLPISIKKKLITDDGKMHGNQIIYSGTAYYAFNHFSKRYQMWQDIIRSKGDVDKIAQIFGGENLIPDGFNYGDYSVIRIPYTHLPEGLLDKRQLAHARATLPRNIFLMEYCACFVKDSDGFYPRSLIEGCTVGPNRPIETPDGAVTFTPLMRGIKGPKYVVGIDPAAERDNLAIVIIEVWGNHYRVVYCWVVNKKEFIKRKKHGLITDEDYYAYCCSKIRDIVKLFGPVRIEMDSQGGGYAVAEMLRNKKLFNIENGDFPIYEVVDHNDPKPTDGETDGRQILHLVKQSSEFNQDANIALHKSLETRTLLFPAFDSVKMYAAIEAEKCLGVSFDTYEENVFSLEELKNELCTIQMSETATGREKFDTPTVVSAGAVEGRARKGRLRKDRYIALLLAHKFVYDEHIAPDDAIDYNDVAGNIEKRSKPGKDEVMYRGPGVGRMRNAQYARSGDIFKAIKKGKSI
jgi:intein/homing endonuclease